MGKLAGEQVFLLLRRSSDLLGHHVEAVANFDQALDEWDATTRVSPIFPLDNARFPSPDEGRPWYVFFIGPVDPGCLNLEGLNAFLSYGVYNLIVTTEVEKDPRIVELLAEIGNAPWEGWHVEGTKVVDVSFSKLLNGGANAKRGVVKLALPPQLKSASEEYRTLIAVTREKCALYLPSMVADINAFDNAFQKVLAMPGQHSVAKLAWLANVNAALSRFTSQAFAGTSPILETECHFWTHSLLGIGVASQALVSIRRHHDSAMAASRLSEKVAGLKDIESTDSELTQLRFTHQKWTRHWLKDVQLPPVTSVPEYLRLIAYFSGRDGYRSTPFTLSAPLELITGCNTFAWTPLTLTHELTHTITSMLLAKLLDGAATEVGRARLVKLINPSAKRLPETGLDQARKTLLLAYRILAKESGLDREAEIDGELLGTLLERFQGEVEELITHVLDFQYFYARDVKLYMTAIWESWDVIPNIQSRVDDYLVRTLVAVHSANQHLENPAEQTYQQVLAHLERLSNGAVDTQYITYAYQRLHGAKETFLDRLGRRVSIVKLVLAFFYDPATQLLIAKETPSAGGTYSGLRVDSFDEQRIKNPLRFLVEFASDRNPIPRKALWMLHKLAFAEVA